jgi:hypothetical protein
VKTFGKATCALCNRERMEIIKISWSTPDILINSCLEIHGACRHKPRFHRYHKQETPVLMIAKSMKQSTWKLQIPQEGESIWLT